MIGIVPIIYYSIYYEWDLFIQFYKDNLARKINSEFIQINRRELAEPEEHDIINAKMREYYIR